MKKVLSCALALSFFLFSFPVSSVGAIADDSDDASFYLNYWVEEHTGIDMKDIPVTAYGMSYADYIYRATGYTIDYWVDNATDPGNFVNNTEEYLYYVNYNNAELLKDLLSTTPITETTSQVYGTNYNQRVNSDGDINVSGSNYWNSVYNGLSQNGYKDQYGSSGYDGYQANSSNGISYNVNYVGIGHTSGNASSWCSGSDDIDAYSNNTQGSFCFSVTNSSGQFAYFQSRNNWGFTDWNNKPINLTYSYNADYIIVNWQFEKSDHSGYWNDSAYLQVYGANFVSGQNTNAPVLQPRQVGYVIKDGIKFPVYTDPSQNPFTINPDGTVSFPNDENTYPIFIDPDELSPDGDQYLIQYIINNYYGNDNNDFDPFSSDPNNRLNYPDSNTKDYTDGINSIIAWLKKIYNKESDIVKYLKKITKGLPLSDENDSDDNEDKFENFVSMLSLFNGKNNDGFKHRFLEKIAYPQIQTNIDNFSTALFGSRTFNQDGTVNTSFGGISVTETPELLYTYQGTTHNFWTDLTLLNENGDLTKAKEYVRFFVIFAFFMNLFRSLPSIIKNGQFIVSHAAIPEHESNFVDPDLQTPFEFTQYEDTLMWLDNSYDTVSFNIPDNDDVWFRGG